MVPGNNGQAGQDRVTGGKELPGVLLFLLHAACFLLVAFYVNLFQAWAWLVNRLGTGTVATVLPVAVTVAVLLVIAWFFVQRVNRGHGISLFVLGAGMVAALLALAVPDPDVPIKRIHVAEYILLSFLVRYTLSHRLQGRALTIFTALVTMLFGIHDEMLQGLHSLRYYGWRDILVNGLAGLGGALFGHGLRWFARPAPPDRRQRIAVPPLRLLLLHAVLAAATAWLVVSLFEQRGGYFSILSFLPQAAASLLIVVLHPGYVFSSARHHGLQAVWWLASALLLYPLLANWFGMEFL